uniref:(northern house mosquito) hypothetical protein n=2 Tax=Culex pipiens TaxID=7175 RepID=A0A8D8AZJ6_CULPI
MLSGIITTIVFLSFHNVFIKYVSSMKLEKSCVNSKFHITSLKEKFGKETNRALFLTLYMVAIVCFLLSSILSGCINCCDFSSVLHTLLLVVTRFFVRSHNLELCNSGFDVNTLYTIQRWIFSCCLVLAPNRF